MAPEDFNTPGSEEEPSGGSRGGFRFRMKEFEDDLRRTAKEFDDLIRDGMRNMVPPEVSDHLNKSKREFLLAIRAMVDREIERSEKKPPEEEE